MSERNVFEPRNDDGSWNLGDGSPTDTEEFMALKDSAENTFGKDFMNAIAKLRTVSPTDEKGDLKPGVGLGPIEMESLSSVISDYKAYLSSQHE